MDLRSAFYPFAVVWPAQAFLARLGMTDRESLVMVGTCFVAALSTGGVLIVFEGARRRYGLAVALCAAAFAGWSGLAVSLGSSVLPRAVSGPLVFAAFCCFAQRRLRWTVVAGSVLLAVAAAMRFSEAIFLLPAALQLLFERRRREALLTLMVFTLTAATIQAASDWWEWHQPFVSLLHIVDYTLVQRLSSRGYESPLFYLTNLSAWTDPVIVALAALGTIRGDWRPALWAGASIMVLSCLPHKEPRYLLPIVGFMSLLAALGACRIADDLRVAAGGWRWRSRSVSLLLSGGLAVSCAYQAEQFHVVRSDADVALAQQLAPYAHSGALVEQAWRMGGRIYLGGSHFTDVDPAVFTLPDDGGVWAAVAAQPVAVVAILRGDCARVGCEAPLGRLGYEEILADASSGYRVFVRLGSAWSASRRGLVMPSGPRVAAAGRAD